MDRSLKTVDVPVSEFRSPHTFRHHLDQLDRLRIALHALADLLQPDDGLVLVERAQLAILLAMLAERASAPDPRGGAALIAVVDLIGSGHGLYCLTREHLHALVQVLAQLHAESLAGLQVTAG